MAKVSVLLAVSRQLSAISKCRALGAPLIAFFAMSGIRPTLRRASTVSRYSHSFAQNANEWAPGKFLETRGGGSGSKLNPVLRPKARMGKVGGKERKRHV